MPNIINCIPGDFYGFDAYGEYANYTGETFPSAPELQIHVDAEYDWKIHNNITAFAGIDIAYTSGTNTFFVNNTPTPAYLNVGANGPDPAFGGYLTCAGAPSATPVGPCPTNHPNNPLMFRATPWSTCGSASRRTPGRSSSGAATSPTPGTGRAPTT